jgi:hypothetical protein
MYGLRGGLMARLQIEPQSVTKSCEQSLPNRLSSLTSHVLLQALPLTANEAPLLDLLILQCTTESWLPGAARR